MNISNGNDVTSMLFSVPPSAGGYSGEWVVGHLQEADKIWGYLSEKFGGLVMNRQMQTGNGGSSK